MIVFDVIRALLGFQWVIPTILDYSRQEKQIAINSVLKIDLKGQVCSESIGFRQISGTGGQLEFTRGAYNSPGGHACICFHSPYTNKNGQAGSTIVPAMETSDTITVPAADISQVVTEYSTVNLKGQTDWQRGGPFNLYCAS